MLVLYVYCSFFACVFSAQNKPEKVESTNVTSTASSTATTNTTNNTSTVTSSPSKATSPAVSPQPQQVTVRRYVFIVSECVLYYVYLYFKNF